MVLFLIAGTYFIARAVRREMEVSRMQSRLRLGGFARIPVAVDFDPAALGDSGIGARAERGTAAGVLHDAGARDAAPAAAGGGAAEFRTHGGGRAAPTGSKRSRRRAWSIAWRANSKPQLAAGRRIELSGPDATCAINADPDALSVVLRNLIDNALKYSPEHAGDLGAVGAGARAGGDPGARRGTGDHGGRAEGDLPQIRARKRGGRGQRERVGRRTGDGASTSSRRTTARSGWTASLAQGSTFTVVLPALEQS